MKKPFFLLGYKDNNYTLTSLSSLIAIIFVSIVVLLLVLSWPLVCVWALNALFSLNIAYSFKTWLAALVILVSLTAPLKIKKTTRN